MSKSNEELERKKITVMIQGHEVVLQFAEEANPQVALQVFLGKRITLLLRLSIEHI